MTTTRAAAPNAPGRTPRTEEMRRSFDETLKIKEAEIKRRRESWSALNHFVRSNNKGWITSSPGELSSMRIECEPHSELPDLLIDRSFDLQSLGTGTRIEGGKFLPVCVYALHLPPLVK